VRRVLTSGRAARAGGVSRKALRIYEEKGLVAASAHTAAGYRLYDDDQVQALRFIRQARHLGLGLDEVADILAQYRAGGPVCPTVKGRLAERVREIDDAMRDLAALRRSLLDALGECAEQEVDDPSICPIIDHAMNRRRQPLQGDDDESNG
jgi:MerR family transcriptional regulator, copper efflux regulator